MTATQPEGQERVCLACGTRFHAQGRFRDYCSFACVQASVDLTRTCERCGKTYQGPIWKTFCSGECRARTRIDSSFSQFGTWLRDPDPRGHESVRHYLPYAPDLVALMEFSQVTRDTISLERAREFVSSPSVSTLAKFMVEDERAFGVFVQSLDMIHGMKVERPKGERDLELGQRFLVDSASWVRTLLLNRSGILYHMADVRDDPKFKKAQRRLTRLSERLPTGNLSRCKKCGLLGDSEAHFKRRRFQGRWRPTEACIYCPVDERD